MTILQMRDYISKHPLYKDSLSWRDRCQRMPERQVVAIYNKFRMQDYKKIVDRKKDEYKKLKEQFHQMDIFEYMEGLEK